MSPKNWVLIRRSPTNRGKGRLPPTLLAQSRVINKRKLPRRNQ